MSSTLFASVLLALCVASSWLLAAAAAKPTQLVVCGYHDVGGAFADVFTAFEKQRGLQPKTMTFVPAARAYDMVVMANDPDSDLYTPNCDMMFSDSVMKGLFLTSYLAPYDSPISGNPTDPQHMVSDLYRQISYWNMVPSAYSALAFVFDRTRLAAVPAYKPLLDALNTNTFTLDVLLKSGALDRMVLESPVSGVLGLDLLMWTVAEFGDDLHGITGKARSSNWQQFWNATLASGVTLVDRIEDIWTMFSAQYYNQHSFVGYFGYGTDPTYLMAGLNGTDMIGVGSTIGATYTWASIEGLAVIRRNRTQEVIDEGVAFAQYLLTGPNAQYSLSSGLYMDPALDNATIVPGAPGSIVQLSADWFSPHNLETSYDKRLFSTTGPLAMLNDGFSLDWHTVHYYTAAWQTMWTQRKVSPVLPPALVAAGFTQPFPKAADMGKCNPSPCLATEECLIDALSPLGHRCLLKPTCAQRNCPNAWELCVLSAAGSPTCVVPDACHDESPDCGAGQHCENRIIDQRYMGASCVADAAASSDDSSKTRTIIIVAVVLGGVLLIGLFVCCWLLVSRSGHRFLKEHVLTDIELTNTGAAAATSPTAERPLATV